MSTAVASMSAPPTERYRDAFAPREENALTTLRRAALERFIAAGFPTQRQEEWKYTSLRRLEQRTFAPAVPGTLLTDSPLQSRWIEGAGTRLVFVNGHFAATLSAAQAHPPGITVLTLAQWAQHEPAEVARFLEANRSASESALEDMNLAFGADGLVVQIAAGARLDAPLYVVHQWAPGAQQKMSHPRLIVRAGANSRCTIVEHFLGSDDADQLTNAVATFEVNPGASVQHYRLQQESTRAFHIAQTHARVERDGRFGCHDLALGASLARVHIGVKLAGPGAHAALHGLLAPAGSQHLDAHTLIDHASAHTTSEEDYRGVADGRGRGVFNGKVIVRPDAQKTDARQSSRNLLLSAAAEIDSKPELEIYANDVKCSHGATTGQLDTTALFYLRSRGLSESEARAALIRAFAESVLLSMDREAVRKYLEHTLNERFSSRQETSR